MWDGVIEPTLLPNPRLNLTLIETHYHEWVNHYHTLHLNVNIRNRKILQLCSSYSLQVYFKLSWSHLSLPKSFSDNPASGTTAQFFTSHKEALSMALSVTNPSVFLAQSNSDGCRVGENNSPPPPTANGRSETKVTFYKPINNGGSRRHWKKEKEKKCACCCFKPFLFVPTAEHLDNGLTHDRETTGVSSLWPSHVGSIRETWSSGSPDHHIRKETSQRGGPP